MHDAWHARCMACQWAAAVVNSLRSARKFNNRCMCNVLTHAAMVTAQEGQSEEDARRCPACGSRLGLMLARGGGFIGCRAYPDCSYSRALEVLAPGEPAPSAGVWLDIVGRLVTIPFSSASKPSTCGTACH